MSNDALVLTEDNSGIHSFTIATHCLNNQRKIFMFGEITPEAANETALQITYLQSVSSEPITLVINSPGGSVIDGMVVVDLIEGSQVPIDVVVAGRAMSMAAVILASAKKGHRHLLKSSQVLIHEPRIASGGGGTTTEIETRAESLKAIRNMTSSILARNTGHTLDEINALIKGEDVIFTAEEAIEFGIADDIVSGF